MTVRLPQRGELFDGRFHIESTVGAGGFGQVYAAVDATTGDRVAVKVILPDDAGEYDRATRARFQREVSLVAGLSSPHVVELQGSGEADGLLYMVFEFVEGQDLSELMKRQGRQQPAQVRHIIEQVLRALQAAHAAGLLHRDIKPENIRLFKDGGDPLTVKLLDFGIARPTDFGSPSITATGEVIGTPRYMSPEQLTAKPLTAASDIYSLGMVALEMLAGPEAMLGNRWGEQLDRLRSGHLFAVSGHGADAALAAIIQRMTAREPGDRFPSAKSVLDALHGHQSAARRARAATSNEAPKASSASLLVILAMVAMMIGIAVAFLISATSTQARAPAAVRTLPVSTQQGAAVEPAVASQDAPDITEFVDVVDAAQRVSGCGSDPPFTGLGVLAGPRPVDAYVPRAYQADRKYPVVILLHQVVELPRVLLSNGGFAAVADLEGFVVVAPTTVSKPGILTLFGPTAAAWTNVAADLQNVRQTLLRADRQLCLDPTRVFVVGHGQGGRMARRLLCEPWVAAGATNSFRAGSRDALCEASKPYMMLSPLHSPREPVHGGKGCGIKGSQGVVLSLAAAQDGWKRRNGCEGARKRYLRGKGDSACYTWDCKVPFRSCHLDGGHGWPGTPPRPEVVGSDCEGAPPPDFPSVRRIWEFFETVESLAVEQTYVSEL